jgi:alpha-L-rhamnosidase
MVKASYYSVSGQIVSEWKKQGGPLVFQCVIPANMTATVYLPSADLARITESGGPAQHAPSVKFLRIEKSSAVFSIGSGAYVFQSNLP